MKKSLVILFASLVLALTPWTTIRAQVEIDDEDTEETLDFDDEDEEEGDDDDVASTEIDIPVGMEAEMDSLLSEWNNKTYLIPEGDCTDTGINPDFDRETYIHRLQRLPNVIEMPYNDVVRHFIDQYTGRGEHHPRRQQFLHAHLRGGPRGLSVAVRAKVPARYRECTEPAGRKPRRCRWPVAVYDYHWQAVRP